TCGGRHRRGVTKPARARDRFDAMLALTVAPEPARVALTEIADPVALPDEAVVEVRAVSLNRGEVKRLESSPPGAVTGWDVGGVGRLAVQLARDSGADVVAVARRTAGLAELGAAEVVTALEPEGEPLDGVLDGVGGPVLGAAIQRVRADGTVVSYAATLTEPV